MSTAPSYDSHQTMQQVSGTESDKRDWQMIDTLSATMSACVTLAAVCAPLMTTRPGPFRYTVRVWPGSSVVSVWLSARLFDCRQQDTSQATGLQAEQAICMLPVYAPDGTIASCWVCHMFLAMNNRAKAGRMQEATASGLCLYLGSHSRYNMVLEGGSQNRGSQQLIWRVAKVGL